MQQASSAPMSTTSCLNACHAAYTSSVPFPLEASTSLVVNTWATAVSGGTVDGELATRAWEHARRRAEDGCIILGYVLLQIQDDTANQRLTTLKGRYIRRLPPFWRLSSPCSLLPFPRPSSQLSKH